MQQLPNRLPAFDVVRGIAILLVLGYHSLGAAYGIHHVPLGPLWPKLDGLPRSFLALFPLTLGWVGVPLFFIASGFTIHYSTLRHPERHSTWQFYLRRFWRIVPTYWVILLLVIKFHPYRSYSLRGWDVWSHVTLLHDVTPGTFLSINPSLWSLAVEWHIYLIYPLLILCTRRTLLWILLWAISLVAQASTALIPMSDENAAWLSMSVVALTAHWWLGAKMAEAFTSGKRLFRSWWTVPLILAFALSSLCTVTQPFQRTIGILASASLAEWLLHRPSFGTLGKIIGFVGVVSYSLYLIHQPILLRLSYLYEGHPLVRFALLVCSWPVLVLLAWASFRTLENGSEWIGKRLLARQN